MAIHNRYQPHRPNACDKTEPEESYFLRGQPLTKDWTASNVSRWKNRLVPAEEHYKRRSRSEEATFSTFHRSRSPTTKIPKVDFSKPPPPIRPVNPTPRTSNYPLPPGTKEFFKTLLEMTSSKIQAQLKELDSA